ncbi:MAG: ATP-binding protein [Candidatus Cloacimonetes bacterium]|nr:ATP-binding protein [Candidatus Cloacimonadota bacterium]
MQKITWIYDFSEINLMRKTANIIGNGEQFFQRDNYPTKISKIIITDKTENTLRLNNPLLLISDEHSLTENCFYEVIGSGFCEEGMKYALNSAIEKFKMKTISDSNNVSLVYKKELPGLLSLMIRQKDVSKSFPKIMEVLGRITNSDKILTIIYDVIKQEIINNFEWTNENFKSKKAMLNEINSEECFRIIERIKSNVIIQVKDDFEAISDTPQSESFFFDRSDFNSLLIIPLSVDNKIFGFIGFFTKNSDRSWLPEEIELLKIFAQLISNHLERIRIENELLKEKERYKTIFEMSKIALWEIDFAPLIKYLQSHPQKKYPKKANDYHKKITNLLKLIKVIDVNQETIDLFKAKDKNDFIENMNQIILKESLEDYFDAINQFSGRMKFVEFETINRDFQGNILRLLYRASLDDSSNNSRFILCVVDITEKHRKEEEIQNSQRLESIGYLAGGIAHDFNNLLTTILGNVSLMIQNSQPSSKAELFYKKTLAAIDLSTKLTKQLLTFSSGGFPLKSIVSVADIVESTLDFTLSGSKIMKKLEIDSDLYPIEADSGQISHALNNIFLNSLQAMPKGGELIVKCANVELEKNEISNRPAGKYVRITIEDFGTGIEKKILDKVFYPYFTTKTVGSTKGTGLGLSITYSIINKHNGWMYLESEYKKGTKVTLFLPATEKKTEMYGDSDLYMREKILVMDDEQGILDVVEKILTQYGYDTDIAKDGKTAVKMYKHQYLEGNCYAAVILDNTIPGGMGGKEVIKELLKIDLDVRAILTSGYTNDEVMSRYKEYGFSASIEKPFTFEKMNQLIRKVMKR